jgi:hypothetical protein
MKIMGPKVVGKKATCNGVMIFIGSEDDEYYYVTASQAEKHDITFIEDAIYLGHSEWMGKIKKSETNVQYIQETPPNTYKAP